MRHATSKSGSHRVLHWFCRTHRDAMRQSEIIIGRPKIDKVLPAETDTKIPRQFSDCDRSPRLAQQIERVLKPAATTLQSANNHMKKIFTKLESATIANVSVRTIENWMKNGVLSYIKIRGIVRIPEDALLETMDRHLIKGRNTRKKGAAIGD